MTISMVMEVALAGPLSGKAHVRERLRDEREGAARQAQHERRSIPILNVGGLGLQDESAPVRVHHDLPLAPFHLLARVIAPRSPALGGLDALAVDHGCAGRRLAPDPLPVGHDEQVVHGLEQTRVAPQS